jgi:hypothetical protein
MTLDGKFKPVFSFPDILNNPPSFHPAGRGISNHARQRKSVGLCGALAV